jgi:excisionase family DNA binding protein
MSGQSLLKPKEVAERLAVSRSWIYDAAADGRLPSIRLGGPNGPLRFHPKDLAACIEEARARWHPSATSKRVLRGARRIG